MKTTITTLALAALLVAGACSNDQNTSRATAESTATPAATAQELTPEQLGELGAEIGKNPDEAESLLARRGLDGQKFEQAIRRISENPEASKRYAESYRKKSA